MKKPLLSVFIALLLIIPPLSNNVSAAGSLTGETSRTTEKITLSDGTDTGVSLTTVSFGGHYGNNKKLVLATADLSDTHLSLDVFNCGTYLVSKSRVSTAAKALSKDGKTALCAINGDLWMTSSYSNATKTLAVSRGVMMIDGELWATQETPLEAGIYGTKDAFGITDKNQPIVGTPEFSLSLSSASTGIINCEGLNRLPANNGITVYNHRVNSSNYALTDSYEIELRTVSPAFSLSKKVSAEVVAIYPAGSESRPAIDKDTVLITARGTRISEVEKLSVGDSVEFSLSVKDAGGNTDLWYSAVDIIGGHKTVLRDSLDVSLDTSSSEYPTSLIGIGDDGRVMLATVTADIDGVYKGLRFKHAIEFCRELGYNSVFYLDGGGSSTMAVLENGTYTVRSCSSDGSPRSVINGIAFTWNDTPVCEQQGDLNYICTGEYLTGESPTFIDGALLPSVLRYKNHVSVRKASHSTACVKAQFDTNDPFFEIDYSRFSETSCEDFKYAVIKLKASSETGDGKLGLFYACGNDTYFSGDRYTSALFSANGEWQYLTIPLFRLAGFSGKLNSLRLDIYDSTVVSAGTKVEIGFIALCKTLSEAKNAAADIPPEGSVGWYSCYKGIHQPVLTGKIEATCTEDGYSGDTVCEVCSAIISSGKAEVARGHLYENGSCTRCSSLLGDIDLDGKLSAKDSNLLERITAGSAKETDAADIDRNGKVNSSDAALLRELLRG